MNLLRNISDSSGISKQKVGKKSSRRNGKLEVPREERNSFDFKSPDEENQSFC